MTTRTSTAVPHAEYFPLERKRTFHPALLLAPRREISEIVRFWPVIANMVIQELRVRYQRSFLGFFWTLLNPILMMTVLGFVFSNLYQGRTGDNFTLYLFAGMVPWGFVQSSIGESALCFIVNEGLIKKIYIPKIVFPLTRLLINLTTLGFTLTALFLMLIPLGARPSLALFALPAALVLLAAFVLGLSLIVSTLNTFYRDCGHLVSVFLQAWYFATPIIYKAEFLPQRIRWWLVFNPAYPVVKLFQDILAGGRWPDWPTWLMAAGIAATSVGVGYATFKSQEDKLVFRL